MVKILQEMRMVFLTIDIFGKSFPSVINFSSLKSKLFDLVQSDNFDVGTSVPNLVCLLAIPPEYERINDYWNIFQLGKSVLPLQKSYFRPE